VKNWINGYVDGNENILLNSYILNVHSRTCTFPQLLTYFYIQVQRRWYQTSFVTLPRLGGPYSVLLILQLLTFDDESYIGGCTEA
jgi:hypothetical protein